MKLIKVRAKEDIYYEDSNGLSTGTPFCTKDEIYDIHSNVIKSLLDSDQPLDMFCIRDDQGEIHWFVTNDCDYFELIYE
jgi:hypothetical protein